MGIVNVTPDSFYEGSRHEGSAAMTHVDALISAGADIIDIGGESTRPGAKRVSADEQLRRIEPVLRHATSRSGIVVSLDTTLPQVASRGLELGAQWVNDVSCLANDDLARVTARAGAKLVLMHSRPDMARMRGFSQYPDAAYQDVVLDVLSEWSQARDRAVAAGLSPSSIYFDPGLGFSKNAKQSLRLLSRLDEFSVLQTPIVVGPSRKSFIASLDGAPPPERLGGTLAACIWAAQHGASVLRVHDVREVRQALAVLSAIDGGTADG